MPWNWQFKNWPDFEFTSEVLLPYEKVFLQKAGMHDLPSKKRAFSHLNGILQNEKPRKH